MYPVVVAKGLQTAIVNGWINETLTIGGCDKGSASEVRSLGNPTKKGGMTQLKHELDNSSFISFNFMQDKVLNDSVFALVHFAQTEC